MGVERSVSTAPPVVARGAEASLSILVVDDESDLREMLTRSFSREGHRVLAVAAGRAAVDRASTTPFGMRRLQLGPRCGPPRYGSRPRPRCPGMSRPAQLLRAPS